MHAHSPDADRTTATAPLRQRSDGRVRLRAGPASLGGATRILDLSEAGPSRLRFPRGAGGLEAVLVNTAGGVACGDTFSIALELEPAADLTLTTTAAEKIYRSDGPVSRIENRLNLGAEARLAWLPQETILFDQARVSRRFEADLAPGASLLAVEIVAFGRVARGERITAGLFSDSWRVRRAGRLAYADTFTIAGPISDLLARPAIGGGACACATLLDVSDGAEGRLEEARALLKAADPAGIEAAASAWNGHLVVRALARGVGPLRALMAHCLAGYRGLPMPRVWQC
ncbi:MULTISPECIES: urease accessory protein UreD [unclassified Methylobacterium]|jgi:urease accessory protein|uniref:urease accessory protein UreD n=1 Tax=unclassified Methylobacterium TaxID=2615210 RepID=UPI0013540A5F|nr:urease accessory protein UreD [Methylobacterium sp. 2A]MWV24072.1 urease accessory protein UreD [Methylobacterium sp. 2A]